VGYLYDTVGQQTRLLVTSDRFVTSLDCGRFTPTRSDPPRLVPLNNSDKCSIALCPAKRHKVKSQELAIMSVIPPQRVGQRNGKKKSLLSGRLQNQPPANLKNLVIRDEPCLIALCYIWLMPSNLKKLVRCLRDLSADESPFPIRFLGSKICRTAGLKNPPLAYLVNPRIVAV
jgi:hypothetical protein